MLSISTHRRPPNARPRFGQSRLLSLRTLAPVYLSGRSFAMARRLCVLAFPPLSLSKPSSLKPQASGPVIDDRTTCAGSELSSTSMCRPVSPWMSGHWLLTELAELDHILPYSEILLLVLMSARRRPALWQCVDGCGIVRRCVPCSPSA